MITRPKRLRKGRREAYADQSDQHIPAEDHGKRSRALELADTGEADAGENQHPNGEYINGRAQPVEHRVLRYVYQSSQVAGQRIFEVEAFRRSARVKRNRR